jgi:HEAT repeat protein/energy-coupling factor transporter ATP-binding protein EcfA2
MTHIETIEEGGDETGKSQAINRENPSEATIARGTGAIAAGSRAEYNATGKGSSVQDNRTIVILNSTTEAPAPLSTEQASEALNSYAEQIRAAYGRLDLEALIPTTEGEHPRVELREVFTPPLLRADPPRLELPVELHRRLVECGELSGPKDDVPQIPGMSQEAWEQARQAYRERPAVKLLDTLASAESNRIVLLGDPGSGKSTLARYMALVLTSRALTGPLEPLSGLLPVVIELRRYADADWREKSFEEFLAFVHKHEGNAPEPTLLRHFLDNGQSMVVFDGLDELFDPRIRADVARRIKGFASRYPGIRIVVTSRVIGYNRHVLDAAGFRHYMIQSLNDRQIEDFTARWYEAVSPTNKLESERLRTRLGEAIARSRPVRELAGNPLLLTILAIIARRQRLPRDRAGVYHHAVNVLVAHWDEDAKHLDLTSDIRVIADLDDRDRREMLERLARHMQSGDGGIAGNHVLGEDVEQVFTEYLQETLQLDLAPAKKVSRAMVKQFRERNFILSLYGSQVYGFVHRAFLEYLAASDIVRRYERRELTDSELLNDVFALRAPDPTWHEVLLLIIGQLGERVAAPAIEKILELEVEPQVRAVAPSAVLALRALTEVRRVGVLEEQSIKTAKALTRYWERNHVVPPGIETDTEISLNSLGPYWAGSRYIRRWLHASGGGIMSSEGAYCLFPEMEVLKAITTHAWDPAARANALPELAKRWRTEAGVFSLAQSLALDDPAYIVRSDALDVLADYWAEDPSVRELIERRATDDPHEYVRRWALVALADNWSDDPAVLAFLFRRAVEDTHHNVGRSALEALVDHWGSEPKVFQFIKIRAVEDARESVRVEALNLLGQHWEKDPDVCELMQKRCSDDSDEGPRSRALGILAEGWSQVPAVRDLVQCRAVEDPHEEVRSDALDALADQWAPAPGVREFILRRTSEDPHEYVRRWGFITLARHWPQHPSVIALVLQHAAADQHEDVRSGALNTLADHWAQEPGVHELIERRTTEDPHEDVRSRALLMLGRYWAQEPGVHELIERRTTEDPHEDVRSRALTILADHWAQEPGVRELIERRTTEDPHEDVRSRALTVLADHWTGKPVSEGLVQDLRARVCSDASDDTRDFLIDTLKHSEFQEVRTAAAQSLAALWPADRLTIPALRAQEKSDPDQKVRDAMKQLIAVARGYTAVREQLW